MVFIPSVPLSFMVNGGGVSGVGLTPKSILYLVAFVHARVWRSAIVDCMYPRPAQISFDEN